MPTVRFLWLTRGFACVSLAYYAVYLISCCKCDFVTIPFKKKHTNKALGRHWRFASEKVKGFGPCAHLCLTMTRCKSLNYWTTTGQCELNKVDSVLAGEGLSNATGCVFVDRISLPWPMAGGCNGHNCSQNEHCIPGSSKMPNCEKNSCPEGYSRFKDGTFCYTFHDTCKTWIEARNTCQKDGADLPVIQNNQMLYFIEELYKLLKTERCSKVYRGVWLGATKSNNSNWLWITNATMSLSYWGPREPNGNKECVQIRTYKDTGYAFDDTSCVSKVRFVCQLFI